MKIIMIIVILILLSSLVIGIDVIGSTKTNITIQDIWNEIDKAIALDTALVIRDETTPVCDLSDIIARLEALEAKLNITQEPEEAQLYSCVSDDNQGRECPYGLSGLNNDGLQTRCYTAQVFGVNTYFDYCSSGWVLNE